MSEKSDFFEKDDAIYSIAETAVQQSEVFTNGKKGRFIHVSLGIVGAVITVLSVEAGGSPYKEECPSNTLLLNVFPDTEVYTFETSKGAALVAESKTTDLKDGRIHLVVPFPGYILTPVLSTKDNGQQLKIFSRAAIDGWN